MWWPQQQLPWSLQASQASSPVPPPGQQQQVLLPLLQQQQMWWPQQQLPWSLQASQASSPLPLPQQQQQVLLPFLQQQQLWQLMHRHQVQQQHLQQQAWLEQWAQQHQLQQQFLQQQVALQRWAAQQQQHLLSQMQNAQYLAIGQTQSQHQLEQQQSKPPLQQEQEQQPQQQQQPPPPQQQQQQQQSRPHYQQQRPLAHAPSHRQAITQPDWYQQFAQHAQDVQRHHWQQSTNIQRHRIWQEFDAWCRQRLGQPAIQSSPNDLLVYVCSHWVRSHGRQMLSTGARIPAPSSLNVMFAHLSTRFAELGRRGDWEPDTGRGNPCCSMEVQTFKGGYSNLMQEAGFQPHAVRPLPHWKQQVLVAGLEAEADAVRESGDQPWHVEALLRRDAAVAELLWDSQRRPAEIGQLRTSTTSIAGGQLRGEASSSKMTHASRGARRPRAIEVQGDAGTNLCRLLESYVACLQRHGKELGAFLFSPLQRDGSSLDGSRGLSSSAMTKRVVGHLQRLHLYAGETVYSLKRGSMQYSFYVQGRTMEAIGEAADIDTPAVVQLYLDPHRHL
jgi:hypothetical protein